MRHLPTFSAAIDRIDATVAIDAVVVNATSAVPALSAAPALTAATANINAVDGPVCFTALAIGIAFRDGFVEPVRPALARLDEVAPERGPAGGRFR